MEFCRYVFLISILAGSTSIGFLLSRGYSDRLKELNDLSNLINILKTGKFWLQKDYRVLTKTDYISIVQDMYQKNMLPCKNKKEGKLRFEEFKRKLF